LADMALHDEKAFSAVADKAKAALAVWRNEVFSIFLTFN
jgi:hypothetical protein